MQFFPKFFLLHVSMGETHRGQRGGYKGADAVKAGVCNNEVAPREPNTKGLFSSGVSYLFVAINKHHCIYVP